MFTPPPFQASYTAPGWPIQWEPVRSKPADFFPFTHGGGTVTYWPDFCERPEAERVWRIAQRLDPNVQLINLLGNDPLPPGTGAYPVYLQPWGMNPFEVSVYVLLGYSGQARFLISAGQLVDAREGLRDPLQEQYFMKAGTMWDMWGNLVGNTSTWPWDALYAAHSDWYPQECSLYWGNQSTGPLV